MCKYIMWLTIFPYDEHGIRYEWCEMKNVTVCVKDVFYVIAIVPVVSPRRLYRFTYYIDNVLTIY